VLFGMLLWMLFWMLLETLFVMLFRVLFGCCLDALLIWMLLGTGQISEKIANVIIKPCGQEATSRTGPKLLLGWFRV